MNQEKTIQNEYYRELDPKDIDMWVEASDAEVAGMPLDSKMRAILTTFNGYFKDYDRLGFYPDIIATPLSEDRIMALAATCSITRQLWSCMPFALNKWCLDTPTA